ncbi:hypothetical protein R6Q59_029651 [Mikania micrantha]
MVEAREQWEEVQRRKRFNQKSSVNGGPSKFSQLNCSERNQYDRSNFQNRVLDRCIDEEREEGELVEHHDEPIPSMDGEGHLTRPSKKVAAHNEIHDKVNETFNYYMEDIGGIQKVVTVPDNLNSSSLNVNMERRDSDGLEHTGPDTNNISNPYPSTVHAVLDEGFSNADVAVQKVPERVHETPNTNFLNIPVSSYGPGEFGPYIGLDIPESRPKKRPRSDVCEISGSISVTQTMADLNVQSLTPDLNLPSPSKNNRAARRNRRKGLPAVRNNAVDAVSV